MQALCMSSTTGLRNCIHDYRSLHQKRDSTLYKISCKLPKTRYSSDDILHRNSALLKWRHHCSTNSKFWVTPFATSKVIDPSCFQISASDNAGDQKYESLKNVAKYMVLVSVAVGLASLCSVQSAAAHAHLSFPTTSHASIAAGNGKHLLASGWMGLVAGCLHTLTGPDHLAALAPLSIGRTKLESVAIGALWGFGHDAGQVIFGILFLLLKDKLQIEILRAWGTRIVALTLVTIGVVGLKEAKEAALPCLAAETGYIAALVPADSLAGKRKNAGIATFATGIIHGLQPDALLMILPALALPSRFAGAVFLSMFLFGTVLAMSGYTAFIGSCSNALKNRVPRITEHLTWISSLVSILVGLAILGGEAFGVNIL